MKALVLEDIQDLHVRDVADAKPGPEGLVISVKANGVCRSDWHVWNGDVKRELPLIMGHELTGVVEEVAPGVTRFKAGDRVVLPFTGGEGSCAYCQEGHQHLCDSPVVPGRTYPGGYAEYVSVSYADRNLVPLPDEVSFSEGAALGCRFMTSYFGLIHRARIHPGEWVAVFGCGGVGLSAINIAAALGCKVIGVDINPANLELAQAMGAHAVVDSRSIDPIEAIRDITRGGAHVSVDALGLTETCVNGIKSLRKGGRHLQVGITTRKEAGYISIPVDLIVVRAIEFLGTLGMPPYLMESMMPMVVQKQLMPGKMLNREVALSDVQSLFESMTTSSATGVYVVTDFH